MKRVSVTIGIPVYLVEGVVEMSLKSALEQSYDEIDYLLVDDCGNDHSMDVINGILANHPRNPRVKIFKHSQNLGLGEARNTVIKNAKTDYVYFMDSDDIIESNTIEILVNKSERYNSPDIVVANHKTVYLDGKEVTMSTVKEDTFLSSKKNIREYYKRNNIRLSSWNKLYSTKFLKENGFKYIHRFHEDYYFSLQEILYANSILIVPDTTYHYILRNQSITGGLKLSHQMVDRLIPVADDIKDFLRAHDVDDVIIGKKYVDLLTHILYISTIVNHPRRRDLLFIYKKEDVAYRLIKENVTMLSKAFLLGRILPNIIFPLYWDWITRVVKNKRR